jgi:hypothetical protein
MSTQEIDDEIDLIKVPETNSSEMIALLGQIVDGMVNQLPFTFSIGDLMSALLYSVVDAGMQGGPSPEKLREDIINAVDRIIPDVMAQVEAGKRRMN